MKVLFLFVELQNLSESGIFSDLIKEFDKQGHKVKVAAPANKKGDYGLRKETNIEILRFKTGQLTRNASNISKGVSYIKYIFQITSAIWKYYRNEKFDLLISHSLPPELGIVIKLLKWKYKAKFYLLLCEYIWQDSVSLGFFRENGLICKYYKWLEKNTIEAADYIGCPSQGNIDFAAKYYPWIKNKNVEVLHYSYYPIHIKDNDGVLMKKLGLEGKFVAIYGGNITIAQKIENIVELAEKCLEVNDLVFLILGRGVKLNTIREDVQKRGVSNIIFLDFLPKNEYLELLSSCDVGLISLNEDLAIPNIPSKTLSYFCLSVPILASIDYVTDYGEYLEKANAGLWSYGGDTERFKENLLKLYENPELKETMGRNGYRFYCEKMTPEKSCQTIMNQINKIKE